MDKWLSQLVPPGPWHDATVEALQAGWTILVGVLLYLVIRWLAMRAIRAVMWPLRARAHHEGGATSQARLDTLEGLARSAATYILLFLVVVTVAGQFGVNLAAILAGAGVVGLALSFGAQKLVRDILAGFFILLEDQYRVGEVVTLLAIDLPEFTGTILEMGLRITRMRDMSGKIVTMANGDITTVVNHNRGNLRATVEIGVPPETAVTDVQNLLKEVTLPNTLFTGCAEVEGVSDLDQDKTVLRISAPSVAGKAPEAELILRQALGEGLRKSGVEIR